MNYFKNYSALFIGGGNTFKLLSEIKQNGNYEKVVEYLKNDGIVFGGSAGAIIFGKDINTCFIDDGNSVKNKNLQHMSKYSLNNKMIYLAEESVIYINNDKISLIGDSKYVVFKDGKYFIHRPANFKNNILN